MYRKFLASVGAECRKARRMRDITIKQASYDLGFSYETIQQFETGKKSLSAARVDEYLKYLKLHLKIVGVIMTSAPEYLTGRRSGKAKKLQRRIVWNPAEQDVVGG